MATILTTLSGISNYPIPMPTLEEALYEYGLVPSDEMDDTTRKSNEYKLAKARAYEFLAEAPNISQGGVTFSFTAEEKATFKSKAAELQEEAGLTTDAGYGYQGEDF